MAFRSPRFPALLLLAACACAYRPDERDPKLDVSKQRANSSSPQLRTTKTDIATATATDPTKPRKLKEVTAVTGEKTASNLGSGSGFSSSSSSRSSAADARSVSSVRQEEKDEQQHERTRSSSTSSTNNNNDNSAPGSSKKTGEHARVSLSLESLEKSTKYDGASAFQVRVSMRNIDTQGLIFARFDSPFTESSHGIENKLFLVEPKHAARFKGRMVDRRNHFRKNDFSTLAPNETVTAEFDLRHYLAFSKLGKVTISIRFDLVSSEYHEQKYLDAHNPPEGYNMSGLVETLVSSNAIELDVTDTKHQHHRINRYAQEVERLQQEHTANGSVGVGISFLREKGVLASRKLENGASISYVSCRADQIHIINSAIHLARQMAYSSDYFNENGLQQNKLVEWFGGTTYQSSISNDYDQIYEHQIGTSYSFSCACDVDGTYAYIYPDDRSKTIYLCNEFWRAPSNQDRDCQAGTILHEMSHFYDVADTNDNAYGTTAIKELAMTDHLAASQNADTFEAFSEDTPNIGGNVNFPTSFPTPAGASMAPSSYSSTTTSNECFAGGSTLLLESGKRIAIQDVRVGDRVQVPTGIASVDSDSDSDSDSESFGFSSVVFVPHRRNDFWADFIRIETETGKTLKLTGAHLVVGLGSDNDDECQGSFGLMRADRFREGHCVKTVDGTEKVVKVGKVSATGVYTIVCAERSGRVVVDGIVASSFASGDASPWVDVVVNRYYDLHRLLHRVFPVWVVDSDVAYHANLWVGNVAGVLAEWLELV